VTASLRRPSEASKTPTTTKLGPAFYLEPPSEVTFSNDTGDEKLSFSFFYCHPLFPDQLALA
jgi:hypothetical protein